MVHIESRKSKRTNSEYEIFVSLESQKGDLHVPKLVDSLKRQLSYIKIGGDNGNNGSRNGSVSSSKSGNGFNNQPIEEDKNNDQNDDVFEDDNNGCLLDTSNSSIVNDSGVMVRRSKKIFINLIIVK